jgi:hypothetical protein
MVTLEVIRQALREESTESSNPPRPKMASQVKSKAKHMLVIFFDIKGIAHKKIHPGRPKN